MDDRTEITLGLVAAALAVLVGLSFLLGTGDEAAVRRPSSARRGIEGVPDFGAPAGPAELAIFAPLGEGDRLGEWEIEAIDAVTEGIIVVHLLHGESRISLPIGLTEGATILPPTIAGPYAIYQTHFHGPDALGTTASTLAASLGAMMQANLEVPIPAGMGPYRPHDASPTPE